mgnify:CR=1 FL=1
MIRTPLRPLARILQARARGENPDAIERENRRLRHEAMKDRSRARSEVRLVVLAFLVALGFGAVAVRMGTLAAVKPTEPETAGGGAASIIAQRADIVDRRGRILATNLLTYALYAQPALMVDKTSSLALEQHKASLEELKGPNQSAEWGNQIRSYVLHPYNMVKDLRTGYQTSDAEAVLDGGLDPFIDAYLKP